ncbi:MULTISPECIES: hypothetical protein [unclassified Streptomyces]|uniref:hypothetical protein n=2 Tax=Streptomyces TaxID=1883 RepID=UPI00087FE80E|nr:MULTISPECIES: hypothetical protein [unclassified Streptomyces]PBC80217.1 hypothetical protein BX261_0026 [Streptomyces sp. 2321.6]PBC87084.1 hypothetical protein BX261_7222 [Streptomyces sp. 2321.6]SDQ62080.1 hypothetical protein SAMN05216511_0028 [Streptomyces sp. KS_16]SDR59762.1 hypothetical protein SAMN05216511_7202 [Streptomyces sp. KS_16]SEB66374.1 hypothetical protein SAMN05428940_0026 [Streptomyces sp. 2133.1]
MKRKLALTAATVALSVGSLAGMTAPAATASPAAPATTAAAVPADSPVKQGHTMTKDAQGRKVAKVTFTQVTGHVVKGWIEKLSKDKICAQAIVKWYKGGKLRDTDLSEKVCRKGQKKYFSMRAGDKHHFNASDVWGGFKLS